MDNHNSMFEDMLSPKAFLKKLPIPGSLDLFGNVFRFATTENFFQVYGDLNFLAKSEVPVNAIGLPGTTDLGVQFHESVVNNVGEFLGGVKFKIKDIVGSLIPDASDEDDITFELNKPLRLAFHDGVASLKLNLRELRIFGKVYQRIVVAVDYSSVMEDNGLKVFLLNHPTVTFLSMDRSSDEQLKPVEDLAAKIFPAQFKFEDLSKIFGPNGSEIDTSVISKLRIENVTMLNGWINMVTKF